MVEEAFGRTSEEEVGYVERFDGGEAGCGVGAAGLPAGIGCSKTVGQAPRFECLGQALLHFLGEPPRCVDEEQSAHRIREGERRRSDFEEEIAGEIRELVDGIGEKAEMRPAFQPRERAFFQILAPVAEDEGRRVAIQWFSGKRVSEAVSEFRRGNGRDSSVPLFPSSSGCGPC